MKRTELAITSSSIELKWGQKHNYSSQNDGPVAHRKSDRKMDHKIHETAPYTIHQLETSSCNHVTFNLKVDVLTNLIRMSSLM